MSDAIPIKRALISVADKVGIADFSSSLQTSGVEILSTGGTARYLKEQSLSIIELQDYIHFPEILGGRVKTLHPKILGGILGERGKDDAEMMHLAIPTIDLVAVNLYPFAQTIADEKHMLADAIENIDIGGVTLIRAAAKNHHHVAVVIDAADYALVMQEMQANHGTLSYAIRLYLAKKAFTYISKYDEVITHYFNELPQEGEPQRDEIASSETLPELFNMQLPKTMDLRYGENPHQQAAYYSNNSTALQQFQGKELSSNNVLDADAAFACVTSISSTACVIVKHATPCGVGMGKDNLEAYQRAYSADPQSAFGGVLAFNRMLDATTAQQMIATQFVELIVAPGFSPEALVILKTKPNIRVIQYNESKSAAPAFDIKCTSTGIVVQQWDRDANAEFRVVTERQPTAAEHRDLLFAWNIAKFVKSNAIVYARDGMTLGIGAGQTSRIFSAQIAVQKAQEFGFDLKDAVMASDGFFPFRDSVDEAAQAGIRAIIHPGGSMRDIEVIEAANAADIAMIFTGIRHFRH